MKFFLDSAKLNEIKEAYATFGIDGVTTNPRHIMASGKPFLTAIQDIADWIAGLGNGNIFVLYTIIVWGSVLVSAFVDNIPYVATMLPVICQLSASLGIEPYLLYFGLLTGATLGGNITPIGASANIAGMGILVRNGYKVSFREFMKIGVPFTLTAVLVGYVFIWIVWGGGI